MRFLVPQFIEVEDKLFGPLTFKQSVYLGGAAGFVAILYVLYGFVVAIIVASPVVVLSIALAFFKVNEQPFIFLLQSATSYTLKHKLYLWKKTTKKQPVSDVEKSDATSIKPFVPKLSESKLKELAWSLDIKETLANETQS